MHGIGDRDKIEAARARLADEAGAYGGENGENGCRVHLSAADLRRPGEVRAMVAGAERAMGGRLDILVNNAGIQHVAPVQDFPDDQWDAILAVVLSSTFHATKAALPGMVARGWGRVVNTGSMHATVASPYKSAYNAAKHGETLFCFGFFFYGGVPGGASARCPPSFECLSSSLSARARADQAASHTLPVSSSSHANKPRLTVRPFPTREHAPTKKTKKASPASQRRPRSSSRARASPSTPSARATASPTSCAASWPTPRAPAACPRRRWWKK